VLILDEPTAGVDVELRRQLWAYVLELNRKGVTIVLTTHYLEEAQELCDQIAIINRGQVVACEPTTTLLRRMDTRMVLVTLPDPIMARRAPVSGPRPVRRLLGGSAPATPPSNRSWPPSARRPASGHLHRGPDLEDVFVSLTSRGASAFPPLPPQAGRKFIGASVCPDVSAHRYHLDT
jgi:ABC-2 type transport system ATP-binding protein